MLNAPPGRLCLWSARRRIGKGHDPCWLIAVCLQLTRNRHKAVVAGPPAQRSCAPDKPIDSPRHDMIMACFRFPSPDMPQYISPYHAPGFHAAALSAGRHRDIVGGRWEETGRIQMDLLMDAGLMPHHRFLDLGAGCMRLGCKLVPYLASGHYWASDISFELMAHGRLTELSDPEALPLDHLIEDGDFEFPGVPADLTYILAFAIFTHLPLYCLERALGQIHARFPLLEKLLFTVFLAPDAGAALLPVRQVDGVVTHRDRTPYHFLADEVEQVALNAGFVCERKPTRLPRGQILYSLCRAD